jgi:hypothetical protein
LSGQAEQLQQSVAFFSVDTTPKQLAVADRRKGSERSPALRLGTGLTPAPVRSGSGNFKPY